MITAGQIISVTLLVISLAVLMITIFTNKLTKPVKFKKYFVAATVVYVTGNILISTVVSIKKEIPLAFTIISECSVIAIYLFSMIMINKLGKSIVELEAEEKEPS